MKKRRGFLASDETIIFNLKNKSYLWACREIKNGELIEIQVTKGRGIGECLTFLEKK
ncbi:MAG: hypothetical protein QXP32_09265 [Nitrososphaeria archaeon]